MFALQLRMANESIGRFVARHAVSNRASVLADAAPYVGVPVEVRARHLDAACRLAAEALAASPWRERALALRDPPHPGWKALVEAALE